MAGQEIAESGQKTGTNYRDNLARARPDSVWDVPVVPGGQTGVGQTGTTGQAGQGQDSACAPSIPVPCAGGTKQLILPYPISANRYWQSFVPPGGRRAFVHLSTEAKAYKRTVAKICAGVGITEPLRGRVAVHVQLYPHRPVDFRTRQRKLGATWDDSVQCLDLDNANKVLLDSLKGFLFEDDAWVRRLSSERMEPDEEGARVVITVEQLQVERPQLDLLGAAA